MWFSHLLRSKKPKIQAPQEVAEIIEVVAPVTLHSRLTKALTLCDIDTLVKNPAANMTILTVYSQSSHDLLTEVVTPSRSLTLTGVTLYSFFKDSYLTPSLVMERLLKLFSDTPVSNYAKHDIDVFIDDLYALSGCKET